MAKRGIFISSISPFLRDKSQKEGWTLCVGSGTSTPMFPDWDSLVERLIARDIGKEKTPELAKKLLSQYSPDALIQAAHDRLSCDEEQFFQILSDELYHDLKACFSPDQWTLFARMVSARPGEFRRSQWLDFLQLIKNYYPSLSALQIAEVISEIQGTDIAPTGIMSFNAEPVLPSLINANIRINKVTNRDAKECFSKQIDLVTHSITNRYSKRLPYYFIHGLLPVPSQVKKQRIIESVDKLIFSESEYLQLANTAFSWQSSIFLEISSTQTVVFIGVSLSDSNMRRWLSWIHINRMKELGKRYSFGGASTTHYWITKHPGTTEERKWIESSVEHLGVRVVWLNDWDQVGEALRLMLGLQPN